MITVTAAADPLAGARRLFKKEARALGRVRGDHDDEDEESTPISLRLSPVSPVSGSSDLHAGSQSIKVQISYPSILRVGFMLR